MSEGLAARGGDVYGVLAGVVRLGGGLGARELRSVWVQASSWLGVACAEASWVSDGPTRNMPPSLSLRRMLCSEQLDKERAHK